MVELWPLTVELFPPISLHKHFNTNLGYVLKQKLHDVKTNKKKNLCSKGTLQLVPGVGNGNFIQYSCLENYMDRGSWQGITKIWT